MNKIFGLIISALTLPGVALAGVKVASLDLMTKGSKGIVNIGLEGRTNDLPDVKISGRTIEVTLAQAEKFNAISKNVKGSQLSADSSGGKAIIRAVLPYEVAANSVDVSVKKSNIEIMFPRSKPTAEKASAETPAVAAAEITKPTHTEAHVSKDLLDEAYLDKLMKDENAPKPNTNIEAKADEVTVKQAAPAQVETKVSAKNETVPKAASSSDNFSFAGYAAKFTVFLALVLGLFYGVVQLLKKGVFSRGKLGFLNSTKMIEVLSTTYIAPKRSLLIVRAHKQIFLVANSESGLTFLSEMSDTSGLMKEGEKLITGSNFDMNLGTEEEREEAEMLVKLKENIMESTPQKEEKGLSKMAVAKDIVKFSDELKKKAKKLKPIEFN